jgi:hypothetical protein
MKKWFRTKLEGAVRLGMCYALSSYLPLYIVNEYPKSGGTWVCQMLSDYLDLPFFRNQFPKFQSSVMHGHYLYNPRLKNVYIVMRDGRDVMVSYYYQSLFKHERFNDRLVKITRRDLNFDDYSDIKKNLPRFIEYKFNNKKHPRFTWSDFVNSWIDKNAPIITYENLLRDTTTVLSQAIYKVCNVQPDQNRLREISEKYSFKSQSSRNPGDENKLSFLRKGIAGDWKNHFSKEARQVFKKFAGNELIKLGYERNHSWIDSY